MSDENDIDVSIEDLDANLDAKVEIEENNEAVVEDIKKDKKSLSDDHAKALEELKQQLEAEKRMRQMAQEEAQNAARKAESVYNELDQNNIQLVKTAIDKLQNDQILLAAQLKEALNNDDPVVYARLQNEIAKSSLQIAQMESGLQELERKRTQQQTQQPLSHERFIDDLISNVSRSSQKSANWLRNNKHHLVSDREVRKMYRAHEDAIDDGIQVDSDAYFSFIEKRLGISNETVRDAQSSTLVEKDEPPIVAPVSRGSQSKNTIRLSKAEVEIAADLGLTPQEYALNKQKLLKEGKLGV